VMNLLPFLICLILFSNYLFNVFQKCRFANNPICSANSISHPQYGCSNETTALETWSSPYYGQNSCNGKSCPGLTLNLQNCSCADPLTITLVIQQPSFSTITDPLIALLQGYLYRGLGLQSQQVWITAATFTENGRVNVTILFFPFDSSTMLDQATVTNITSTLEQEKVNLTSLFQPYYVAIANGLLGKILTMATTPHHFMAFVIVLSPFALTILNDS